MKSAMGRGAALVAAIATTLVLCATGTANAWYNHGGCNKGEAVGLGKTVLNSFDFNVCQKSADIHDVYGEFAAAATPPGNAVVRPRGPVTCADIKGHEVGFYYPFDKKSIPPENPAVTGLMIYALDGGDKPADDRIGFAPVLANANADCSLTSLTVTAAKTASLPLTEGFIKITDNKVTMEKTPEPPLTAPGT